MSHWLYLSIAIVAEVIGTSFLNSSQGFTRLVPSIVVTVGYGVAFYFLSIALRTMSVGIAYAVWAGAGVALITIIDGFHDWPGKNGNAPSCQSDNNCDIDMTEVILQFWRANAKLVTRWQ